MLPCSYSIDTPKCQIRCGVGRCSVLQCVAVCCSVLLCVVCLQRVALCLLDKQQAAREFEYGVAICFNVLQFALMCCNSLHWVVFLQLRQSPKDLE